MTSPSTRWSGKPLKAKVTHSRRSSSSTTTSAQLETPSDSSPSTSPSSAMAPTNASVNGLTEDLANTQLNGPVKHKKRMALDRKQSSPMMPAFMVSAPGKVIVFGEHSVVHGKVCLTSNIEVRC